VLELERSGAPLQGDLVALAGNLAGLEVGQRYIAKDLNRGWPTNGHVSVPITSDKEPEAKQRVELWGELSQAIGEARGPVFFVDMHSSSAPGAPFAVVSHLATPFATQFPLTVILGLEQILEGVLSHCMESEGCTAIAVEGGRNGSLEATENLEAVVWIALGVAGLVSKVTAKVKWAFEHLERARHSLPHVIQATDRHPVTEGNDFQMQPGFASIAPVEMGQLLATERGQPIRAPYAGYVMLPLYQAQGGDGFFLGREVASGSAPRTS
jgi:hypothetical protein